MEVCETYMELMDANERAFVRAFRAGRRQFNEPAWVDEMEKGNNGDDVAADNDESSAFFSFTIREYPIRHLIKTFHVKYWRHLKSEWKKLARSEQIRVTDIFLSGIDKAQG